MRYRLIVWDFDGTLADTLALALETFNDLAKQHGFVPVEDPLAVREMGSLAFLRQHGIPLWKVPRLIQDYHAATKDRMHAVRLFDGLADILGALKARGSRLGILSSNSSDNIRSCLRANGVEDFFDFVVGYPRLFGKAKAIRRLLRSEKVEKQQFLYVGDEVRDLEAAKKADVDCAAVCWGIHSQALLTRQNPTYVWSSTTEVLPALLSPGEGEP